MDKVNASETSAGKGKGPHVSTQKMITPAVLGVPSPHGLKLSLSMTSRDKQELLCKLEEWRKARREKLASSILSKNKSVEKPKIVPTFPKPKPADNTAESCTLKNIPGRESVFERLYKNSSKVKKETDTIPVRVSQVTKSRFSSIPKVVKPNIQSRPSQCKPNPTSNVQVTLEPNPVPNVQVTLEPNPPCSLNETHENLEVPPSDPETVLEKNSTELPVEEAYSEPLSVKTDFIEEIPEKEEIVNVLVESALPENEKLCQEEVIIIKNETCHIVHEKNTLNEEDVPSSTQPSASAEKEKCTDGPTTLESSSSPEKEETKPSNIDFSNKKPSAPSAVGKGKPKIPLRRSISMLYRSKRPPESAIHRAVSENDLKELEMRKSARPSMRPTTNQSQTLAGGSLDTPRKTKPLSSDYLRNKLEDWLTVNGHSLEGYRHLRCFGIGRPTKLLPKEKPAARSALPDAAPADDSDKENLTPPPTVIRQIDDAEVENWLKELYRLISELKYPADRCEEWLAAIRRKCASCTQMPTYWECLAALDEARGDVKSAVEHYEKAIIKGKNVDSVGDALAQLFDKMVIEQGKPSKSKLEKGLDPKNIFKSTIIKFALQQKALKESGLDSKRQQLVATPVRRSTRIHTPLKDHVVSSLQALTPELRSNVTFKPNESLISGQ